jgi:hypothetical protein
VLSRLVALHRPAVEITGGVLANEAMALFK